MELNKTMVTTEVDGRAKFWRLSLTDSMKKIYPIVDHQNKGDYTPIIGRRLLLSESVSDNAVLFYADKCQISVITRLSSFVSYSCIVMAQQPSK